MKSIYNMLRQTPLTLVIVSGCFLTATLSAEELLIPADSDEEIILIDDETAISDEIIIVDDEPATSGDEVIVIEDAGNESSDILIDAGSPDDELFIDNSESSLSDAEFGESDSVITVENVWLEAAALVKDDQPVNGLYYGHATVSAEWDIDSSWEVKATARVDGYRQTGSPDWNEVDFDYGDTYVRYRGENTRVTVGTQKVIWGRIDEVPPTDRLSTVDARRLVLDDLQDRRLARPMLRVETFIDDGKLDFLYLPTFRKAELADRDSVWYPIDRTRGKVLGIEVDSAIAALMPDSRIINDEPDSDDAVGLRYSNAVSDVEYALTVQHGRQSMPYFSYDVFTNTFTARYPKSWLVGGDFAFESEGFTWRFEGAYLSDTPVTNERGYDKVESVNWGAGMEFHPGDGDTRVNLQLTGNHLIDAGNTLERDDLYNFNGSVDMPFAEERWRANLRFFFDLDEKGVYVNPEIAYIALEPHELYLDVHYFDGDEGTLGGFHEDHSLLTLGWRAKF